MSEESVWLNEDGSKILSNLADTAQAMNITKPTMQTWIRDGCPCEQAGGNGRAYQFFVPDVKKWRAQKDIEFQEEEARRQAAIQHEQLSLDTGAGADETVISAKARQEFYVAEHQRSKVEEQRGNLVQSHLVEAQFSKVFKYLSDSLQGLPDRLQRQIGLVPVQVTEVTSIVDEIQHQLADMLCDPNKLQNENTEGDH